jgi:hypothetical protein
LVREWLEIFFSALFIIVLIAVNLIGYALGMGGVSSMLQRILTQEGLWTLIGIIYFLTVGVCIMRRIEKIRNKIE